MRGGISVVMACFNGARYVREQLASIAAQTSPPRELLVGDDGSDDETVAIVEDFAATAPFPVIVGRHERLGVTGNFMTTAAGATSRWIAWSDQDDVWLPDKLRRCTEALEAQRAVLAFHNAAITDEALVPTGRTFRRRRHDALGRFRGEPWECFSGFATVFEASLLDGVDWRRLPPSTVHAGGWHHDELVHELARLAGHRAILHEVLALYRQHQTNTAGAAPTRPVTWHLRTGAQRHERRLEAAVAMREWAATVPRLAGDAAVQRHLDRLVTSHERRLSVHAQVRRAGRVRALAAGVAGGSYLPRVRGGFGARGLAVDVRAAALARS